MEKIQLNIPEIKWIEFDFNGQRIKVKPYAD